MKISNAVYKAIDKNDWSDLPIKAGTPVNISGCESNDATAIGIVTQTVDSKPLIPSILVLVAGEVDKAEIESLYGSSLSEYAMQNMNGIKFFGKDGTPGADPVYTLPTSLFITEATYANDTYSVDHTATEIIDAFLSGKNCILMENGNAIGERDIYHMVEYYRTKSYDIVGFSRMYVAYGTAVFLSFEIETADGSTTVSAYRSELSES